MADEHRYDFREAVAQREPFIFRPGAAAIENGMVASGTRSGTGVVTSDAANTTVWGDSVVYEPLRKGRIDGRDTGGVIYGQLTIGIKSSAATPNGKLTARIRNKGGTWTTCLALTGTIVLSTSEQYLTYDIPYLLTTEEFNAVPFEIAIGVQSDSSTNKAIARIMESSWIAGEYEPGM